MTSLEYQDYLNAIKSRKFKEVKVATYDRKDLMKKQDNKCSRCKKDLRAGYFKIVVDPRTKEKSAVCSDCLVQIPQRK